MRAPAGRLRTAHAPWTRTGAPVSPGTVTPFAYRLKDEYDTGYTRTVSPFDAASTAAWIVVNGPFVACTTSTSARVDPATTARVRKLPANCAGNRSGDRIVRASVG